MNNKWKYTEARKYWKNLSDKELHEFYAHYTTGAGKGTFAGVDENTSFEDYVIYTAMQTEYERQNDI